MIVTVSPLLRKMREPLVDPSFKIKAELYLSESKRRVYWKVHPSQLTLAGCKLHKQYVKPDGYIHCRVSVLFPADLQDFTNQLRKIGYVSAIQPASPLRMQDC